MVGSYRLQWVNRERGDILFHVSDMVTLGRAPDNEIPVDEDGVSRKHCRFLIREGEFHLEDLSSTNGTYLNGKKTSRSVVKHGDEILVGPALFRVVGAEGTASSKETLQVGKETIQLALDAAKSAYPGEQDLPSRALAHLHTLCAVLDAVNVGGDPEDFYETSLLALMKTLDVERGHVVLGTDPQSSPLVNLSRAGASDAEPSRTVLARVLETGESVLANDPADDETLPASPSLLGSAGTGILCVPMEIAGHRHGAIYLASGVDSHPMGEAELRLVTLVARQLALAATNLGRHRLLLAENRVLRGETDSGDVDLVVRSKAMKEVEAMARRVAQSDAIVLLTGETGTGKEVLAQAIHRWGSRSSGNFVAVNCGAIPEAMVESELFGHEKGAFTGAVDRRVGRFEMAHGGTLFLDEVGELPMDTQVKLLRVLEERKFFRVGGEREVETDTRIVAATNRNLEAMVSDGTFREDLLYRLRVVKLIIPPLRDRREDVSALVDHLIARLAEDSGIEAPELTVAARRKLEVYSWPGNVRELRNVLERAMILTSSSQIGESDILLDAEREGTSALEMTAASSLKEMEKIHIRRVLESTGWNKTRAAEILGIGRTNIYEKIRQYGLTPSS